MTSHKFMQATGTVWPASGLESVPRCPVCGEAGRDLLHKGLTDRVFFCAPGEWDMYRCNACASAYLDPRPNMDTIGLAYQHYFTHAEREKYSSLSFIRRLRRRFANGYRNHRYGTREYPASKFGIIATMLTPGVKLTLDANMRYLPRNGTGGKLLDFGCGNGSFLLHARSAGWDVVGVDFDARAVNAARSHGIDVRLGGIDSLDYEVEHFDVITLAHVIEHLHNPIEALQACFKLLEPGGYLWIDTPNISSDGHGLYGPHWRGLEPPRHLVLFTPDSLQKALRTVGFADVCVEPYRPLCNEIFRSSAAIKSGIDPNLQSAIKASPRMVREAERNAKAHSNRREFITVRAVAPA